MAIIPTTVGDIISRQKLFLKFNVGKRNVQMGAAGGDRRGLCVGGESKMRKQIPSISKNDNDQGEGFQVWGMRMCVLSKDNH